MGVPGEDGLSGTGRSSDFCIGCPGDDGGNGAGRCDPFESPPLGDWGSLTFYLQFLLGQALGLA